MYLFENKITAISSTGGKSENPRPASEISWAEIEFNMDRARTLRARFMAHCFRRLGQFGVGVCRQVVVRPFATLSTLHLPPRHGSPG